MRRRRATAQREERDHRGQRSNSTSGYQIRPTLWNERRNRLANPSHEFGLLSFRGEFAVNPGKIYRLGGALSLLSSMLDVTGTQSANKVAASVRAVGDFSTPEPIAAKDKQYQSAEQQTWN